MNKKLMTVSIFLTLCLLLSLTGAGAETRQGTIALEGMEEPIEETLYESPEGFSFWYVADSFEAYQGEAGDIEGTVVASLYTDDFMILSVIPEEEAEEYAEGMDESIADLAASPRVQADVYEELENGRYTFLTLIAEEGQYLIAMGECSLEAAEGNGKYFRKVLDSVTFSGGCLIRAQWGSEETDEDGLAQVILTAKEPVRDVTLLTLEWGDDFSVTWEEDVPVGDIGTDDLVFVEMEFIGDMPGNGIMYTDSEGVTHAYALDISGEDGSLILWDLEEM